MNLTTSRLSIGELSLQYNSFIRELVNSEGWLRFIGDRHVHSDDDADAYIRKIMANPAIQYWVVKLLKEDQPVGVISFIKRDYLPAHDIGFAFLPQHAGKGYAGEAATAVVDELLKEYSEHQLLATTIPENSSSIKLLSKLGLGFDREITVEGEKLHLYSALTEELRINRITSDFFSVFTNKNEQLPRWDLLEYVCLPEIMLIQKKEEEHTVYHLQSFIAPRKDILSDGRLVDFEEREISGETKIQGHIAQRHAVYEKSGVMEGQAFRQSGNKLLQFVKTEGGWKISSVIWEDE